ncbi:uncharacterized protein LOC143239165 isoform X1 [Tachypleus tridentatus]|uniref:uncharacterized protein LOC143239165 isoform X1 n=1 Tax=Tachypleus tridentatus TaxID=6853 RepID=UPI003FD099D8
MISKVFVTCLLAVVAQAVPTPYGYVPEPTYDKPEPYNFAYENKNEYGDTQWQQESGDEYGNKQGSYGYRDAYGVYRQVEYVADEAGFRAVIKTNEPGTANQNPADVQITSEAAPVNYEAPVPHKAYTVPKPTYTPVVKTYAPAYAQTLKSYAPAYAPAFKVPAPAYGYSPLETTTEPASYHKEEY